MVAPPQGESFDAASIYSTPATSQSNDTKFTNLLVDNKRKGKESYTNRPIDHEYLTGLTVFSENFILTYFRFYP